MPSKVPKKTWSKRRNFAISLSYFRTNAPRHFWLISFWFNFLRWWKTNRKKSFMCNISFVGWCDESCGSVFQSSGVTTGRISDALGTHRKIDVLYRCRWVETAMVGHLISGTTTEVMRSNRLPSIAGVLPVGKMVNEDKTDSPTATYEYTWSLYGQLLTGNYRIYYRI